MAMQKTGKPPKAVKPLRVTTVGGPGLANLPTRGVFLNGRAVKQHPDDRAPAEFGWGHTGSGPRALARALAQAANCPGEGFDDYATLLETDYIAEWDADCAELDELIPSPPRP